MQWNAEMINDNIIKRVIIEQRELLTYSSDYLEREQLNIIDKYIKLPHIIIISGPRRAGKSEISYLFYIILTFFTIPLTKFIL